MKFSQIVLSCLLALFFQLSAIAQNIDSPLPTKEEVTQQVLDEIKKRALNRLTGLSANIDGTSSALENFLPDFQLSSLLSDSPNANDPIVADFGFLLFSENKKKFNNAKLQLTINRGAELSKDLSMAFGDMSTTELSDQIDSFDDLELTFSYNIVNKRFGRDIEQYRYLMDELADSFLQSTVELRDKRGDLRNSLLLKLTDFGSFIEKSDSLTTKACDNLLVNDNNDLATAKSDCILLVETQKQINVHKKQRLLPNAGVFSKLVDNQPQLQFSGSVRSRSDLVGADEVSFKLSYEMGSNNMNSLRKLLNGQALTGESYRAVAQQLQKKGDGRFRFSLEYSDIGDQAFVNDQVSFSKLGTEKIMGSIGYGRTLMSKGEEPLLRLDAQVDFEEFLGDTTSQDRVVGTLTITRKITDNLSIPFSIQYANKSEFLSDDNDEITANLGFKYDFAFK